MAQRLAVIRREARHYFCAIIKTRPRARVRVEPRIITRPYFNNSIRLTDIYLPDSIR